MFTAKHCGARCKRSGQPCKAPAMRNGRCRMHGGKSRFGWTHPNFRYGNRSKDVLSRLVGMRQAWLEVNGIKEGTPEAFPRCLE